MNGEKIGVRRIEHRLSAASTRLALAIAPAGYGKSTVIRNFSAGFAVAATSDCIAVQSAAGFAHAVAATLARDDPARAAELAQLRLSGFDDAASWAALAMDSWTRPSPLELVVFENAEAIADDGEIVALLSRLLSRTPGERRIAICSRRSLPISWNRAFAPHEVVLLRSDDLRFGVPEIAAAFCSLDPSVEALERIAHISRGWPIAVFLLLRLARGTSLDAVLERVGGVAFEVLYEYLADQVLAGMPAARLDRLVAVPAVPPMPEERGTRAAADDRVSLAAARVHRNGREQPLTGRELELVVFLAAHRGACRSEEIFETLWPEHERSDQSVLRVYVRRVRLKLGEMAIAAVHGGYALGVDYAVDLDVIERELLQAKRDIRLDPTLRAALEDHWQSLSAGMSNACDAWDWFGPVRARIEDLARELGLLLARDALGRGAYDAVLAVTQRIIERDACDEPARELRIAAHLRAGDRPSALRELRVYRNTLAAELNTSPSAALLALVDDRVAD